MSNLVIRGNKRQGNRFWQTPLSIKWMPRTPPSLFACSAFFIRVFFFVVLVWGFFFPSFCKGKFPQFFRVAPLLPLYGDEGEQRLFLFWFCIVWQAVRLGVVSQPFAFLWKIQPGVSMNSKWGLQGWSHFFLYYYTVQHIFTYSIIT